MVRDRAYGISLHERAEQIKQSDELLSLDKGIAYTEAYFEAQLATLNDQMEQYNRSCKILVDSGEFEEDELPDITSMFPEFPIETFKALTQAKNTAFNMRFAKRFSVPITELQAFVRQISEIFIDVAKKYDIPNEAKIEFANRIRSDIKISKPMDDAQLVTAGGENPASYAQEVEYARS